jgi:hypothetical protein
MMNRYRLFDTACDDLVEVINRHQKDIGKRGMNKKDAHLIRVSVRKLVRDTLGVCFGCKRAGNASIHLNKNDYSNGKLGDILTYRYHVERAYSSLLNLGYLAQVKKGVSNGLVGKYLTRYRATPKLLAMFSTINSIELPAILPADETEPLIRAQKKKLLGIDPRGMKITRNIPVPVIFKTEDRQIPANVMLINKALQLNWIDLELDDSEFDILQERMKGKDDGGGDKFDYLNLANKSLVRIFNSSDLTLGGRFYGGWWQNIPSKYRESLIIDGKRTVEIDFPALHPTILYAEKGLKIGPCAYDGIIIPKDQTDAGKKLARDTVKRCLFAIINSGSEMERAPRGLSLSSFGTNWRKVIDAIQIKHSSIKDSFFSGAGSRLQRVDSDIAEEIMLHFAKLGIPILPMHDSFIMHHGYEQHLRDKMCEVFEKRMGIPMQIETPSEIKHLEYQRIQSSKADTELAVEKFEFGEPTTDDIVYLMTLFNNGHDRRLNRFRNG